MTGFTDLHSHVIFGVDDGASSEADMEAMLDAAHADGIVSLFATAHMTPGIQRFDTVNYLKNLDDARNYCKSKGYAVTLHAGAEILYTPALRDYVVDHPLQTLDNSNRVLMEFVPDVTYRELEAALDLMERYGYVTVLAHIERYACLFCGNRAHWLKENHDVRYQVNTNTVLNERGFFRTRYIRSWFQKKLVDFVASDAHDVLVRPYQMTKAYEELKRRYGQDYACFLTGVQLKQEDKETVKENCVGSFASL